MSARSRLRLFKFPVKNQLHRFTRSKFGSFLFFAILISGGLFSVLPLVYCITTSFKPLDELLIFPPTLFTVKRPTIANYTAIPDLLSGLSVPITRYAFNSIFVSIIGTFLSVIISAMAAFVLSKTEMRFNRLIFTVVQFSLLFNAYTLSVPQYIVYSKIGIINTYLAYIVPAAASSMGVFLMKQYMDGYVPYALIESAHIDGAGWIGIFTRIVLPIVRPCVLTLVMFSFLGIWNSVPSGTIFSESLKTLPTVMSTIAAGGLARSGSSMATSVILMIFPIAVYLISQGSIKETMGSAGIKG